VPTHANNVSSFLQKRCMFVSTCYLILRACLPWYGRPLQYTHQGAPGLVCQLVFLIFFRAPKVADKKVSFITSPAIKQVNQQASMQATKHVSKQVSKQVSKSVSL